MDDYIEQILRDAKRQIATKATSLEQLLSEEQAKSEELLQDAQRLEAEVRARDVRVQRLEDALAQREAEIASLTTDLTAANTRVQALETEKKQNDVRQSDEPATSRLHEIPAQSCQSNSAVTHKRVKLEARPETSGSSPATPEIELSKLLHKYNKLKECYETMQKRYRKERNVWKQWIEVFESLDPNDLKKRSSNATSASPLSEVSPNISRERERNTFVPASEMTKKQKGIETKAPCHDASEDDSQDNIAMPSSAHDGFSIDLDQITRRRFDSTPLAVPDRADVVMAEYESTTTPCPQRGMEQSRPKSAPMEMSSQEDGRYTGLQSVAHSNASSQASAVNVKDEDPSTPRANSRGVKRFHSEYHTSTPSASRLKVAGAQVASNRGLGRYSTSLATKSTESPLSTVPTSRLGQKYGAHEVVRGTARKALHASDCACCSLFYKLAGPAPNSTRPVWDSPVATRSVDKIGSATSRQQVGRHRSVWKRSPTPPSFWDCDFPTSQQILEEKAANDRRRLRKSGEMVARAPEDQSITIKKE